MTIFLNCCFKCDKNTEFWHSNFHVLVCNNCGNKIRPVLSANVIKWINGLAENDFS